MFEFKFTNRETYLASREAWRHDYEVLSKEIRDLKNLMAQRRGWDNSAIQSQLHYKALDARTMLEIYAEAKLEANRQYLAAKAKAA